MYHAKENGRNNYKFFEQEMNVRAVQRQSIEAGLRGGAGTAGIRAALPAENRSSQQHDCRCRGTYSLAAPGTRTESLPCSSYPVAEDCGLILPIGRWVLREACLQARAWAQAGLPPITVAVNTSAVEFNAPDFLESIRATLKDTGLEPRLSGVRTDRKRPDAACRVCQFRAACAQGHGGASLRSMTSARAIPA